jgi:hypothetical protein
MSLSASHRAKGWLVLLGLTLLVCPGLTCPEGGQAPLNPPVTSGDRPPRIVITEVITPNTTNNSAQQGEIVSIQFTGEDDMFDASNPPLARVFASTSGNPTSSEELAITPGFSITIGPGPTSGTVAWNTTGVAPASYFIFAEIDDRSFDPFTGSGNRPVKTTIIDPVLVLPLGSAPENGSPTITLVQPSSDAGVSNEDTLTISFELRDPNSDTDTLTLSYFFDKDLDASNDATQPPLRLQDLDDTIGAGTIPANQLAVLQRNFVIDLNRTPVRKETDEIGRPLPYFVRIRVSDGKGGVADGYADGGVRLLSSASGVVDLLAVGGRLAGATFQGFGGNPHSPLAGDYTGSGFARLGDLDGDGLDDFAIIAESASPFGTTSSGTVYSIYGRPRSIDPNDPNALLSQGRYSGVLSLNTVGTFVPFAPSDPRFRRFFRIRGQVMPHSHESTAVIPTLGVTSVTAMPDVTGDGLPEIIAGAPYNANVVDEEDLDPCDQCVFGDAEFEFLSCTLPPESNTGDNALEADVENLPEFFFANQWQPFDPASPPQLTTPNVDLELETRRILAIERISIVFAGERDPPIPAGFPMQVRLESATGTLLDIAMVPVDMDGNINEEEAVFDFPINDPPLPVDQDDGVSPSVYDGLFTVFIRPTVSVRFDTVKIQVHAITAESETRAFQFVYNDGVPLVGSGDESCGTLAEPFPLNGFALRYLMSSLFDGPACPPINRSLTPFNSLDIGTGGLFEQYVDSRPCDVLDQFGSIPSGGSMANDDITTPYRSGLVYMAASDEYLTKLDETGQWDFVGCPVQPLGQFGQIQGGCLNDSKRGARFRGAWYNPDGSSDSLGAVGGPYQPSSLFGYTVDTMPDINTIFGSSELLISAPGGGGEAATTSVTIDLTSQLMGVYDSSGTVSRTADFDFGMKFEQVLDARLEITGVATNVARLRLAQIFTHPFPPPPTFFFPGTDGTLLFWSGARPPQDPENPGLLNYPDFFSILDPMMPMILGSQLNFEFPEPPLSIPLPVIPEFELGDLPFISLPTAGDLLANGSGTLQLEILDDCAVKDSSVSITSARFIVTALVPGRGEVWIMEGQDYSRDDDISESCNLSLIATDGDPEGGTERPMSWPSTGCDRTPNPDIREFCYPQPLAWMVGEKDGDSFGWARHAGDVDQDGVADIVCGSPMADSVAIGPVHVDPGIPTPPNAIDLANCPPIESGTRMNNGKCYIIYGTPVLQNGLPCQYERFEIRGSHNNDEFGRAQGMAGDLNGDGRADSFFAAEKYDALGSIGGISNKGENAGFVGVLFGNPNLTGEVAINAEKIGTGSFLGCKFIGGSAFNHLGGSNRRASDTHNSQLATTLLDSVDGGQHGVSSAGDFNLDGFDDLLITAPGQTWPSVTIQFTGPVTEGTRVSVFGATTKVFEFDFNNSVSPGNVPVRPTSSDPTAAQAALFTAMDNLANDESLNIASLSSRLEFPDPLPDIPTVTFLARSPAGFNVTSTSVNVPVTTTIRQGVAYLVFGSNNLLNNKTFYLPDDMNRRVSGNRILKGIVFVSAYEKNTAAENDAIFNAAETPDEAPLEAVAGIGDIDGDGSPDIILGAPRADFINILAPDQRRQATGDAYVIYGNNFGLNAAAAP